MKTQLSNCNCPPQHCTCIPCEVPPFCRISYYTGKLLTARDFSCEQNYHVDKRRLHNMSLHGWGVVCGLTVKPHPHCPKLRIVVEPGLAVDQCGREIRLLNEIYLELPQPISAPKEHDPCPPYPAPQPAPDPECDPPPDPDCDPEQEQPECKYWVCLRYCETEKEFSPAPFDECACAGVVQRPNSVCESYCLELTTEEPRCLKEIEEHHRCECENCEDLYKAMRGPCKFPPCDCIPLAVIHRYSPGMEVGERMIDNWKYRLFLPSVHRLDQIVRCLLERIPCHHLTHICDLNWTHGSDLHCHEFRNRFVGHHKGFEIHFDAPVRKEGINRRTFQALIVHHAGPDQPRRMEFAPCHVDILSETHIRLRIEEQYARRHLEDRNFDLYITLRCDVIVNHHGIPVDGNLLARLEHDNATYFVDAPTGDGVPGGPFESWIRIHTGEHHEIH
jgi:hypothetical protein